MDQNEFVGMELIAMGKTKVICSDPKDPNRVLVFHRDTLTAFNGLVSIELPGKGDLACRTNDSVMGLLENAGLPTQVVRRVESNCHSALRCNMVLLEVIARRESHRGGSLAKRLEEFSAGVRFEDPLVEFFYKESVVPTGTPLEMVVDDPYMVFDAVSDHAVLFRPDQLVGSPESAIGTVTLAQLGITREQLFEICQMTQKAFLVIEAAWAKQGVKLVDFKIEFGFAPDGRLVIADVVDNDSWRLSADGVELSKQFMRDAAKKPGGLTEADKERCLELYTRVADMSDQFVP